MKPKHSRFFRTATIIITLGAVAFSGSKSFADSVTISSGNTYVATGGTLPTDTELTNNGTLSLQGGGSETIRWMSGPGATNLSAGSVLTLTSGTSSIAGVISGSGGLTVAGGTVTLSRANTYLGPTNVSSGSLILQGGSAIVNSGGVTVGAAGTLQVVNAETIGSLTHAGNLNGGSTLTVTGATIFNAGTLAAGTTLNATGTDAVFNTGSVINGTVTGTGIMTHGSVSASGALNSSRLGVMSGTLTFSGTSTASMIGILPGATLLSTGNLDNNAGVTNDGTYTVNAPDTIGGVSNYGVINGNSTLTVTDTTLFNPNSSLAAGMTLNATGGSNLLNGVSIAGTLGGGAIRTIGTVSASGALNGSLLNVSSGTLTFSGTSSSAVVDISSGATLLSTGNLANNAAVTNQGTYTVSTADTIGSITNSRLINGGSTLTVTGATIFNAGTLAAGTTLNATGTDAVFNSGSVINGTVTGTGILTYGSVSASGALNSGRLGVQTGTLTFSGTSTTSVIGIATGATLLSTGNLADNAGVINNGTYTVNAADTIGSVSNYGVINGNSTLTVTDTAVFNPNSSLAAGMTLNATGGSNLLNGVSIAGTLGGGAIRTIGTVSASGALNGSLLNVSSGTLTFSGTSSSAAVDISSGATLLSTGNLANNAAVTNQGTYAVNVDDTIQQLSNSGTISGNATLTAALYSLQGGSVIAAGATLGSGDLITSGTVGIQGNVLADRILIGAGTTNVGAMGQLGQTSSIIELAGGATLGNGGGLTYSSLLGNGTVTGDLANAANLSPGTDGTIGLFTVDGDFTNADSGTLRMDAGSLGHDVLRVNGTAFFGGLLEVHSFGGGLQFGEVVKIIDAEGYDGGFNAFTHDMGGVVSFNPLTGELVGGFASQPAAQYGYRLLNLNENQTRTFLSLLDDAHNPGVSDVTVSRSGDLYQFTINPGLIQNGPAELIAAYVASGDPVSGNINAGLVNALSPEVFQGHADYTEHALRSHARSAVDAAAVARQGATQVFAGLTTMHVGAASGQTNAGYDLEAYGVTAGLRHDLRPDTTLGFFLGADTGEIEGSRIDSDAEGYVAGIFGRYRVEETYKLTLTGSLAYGSYRFDSTRESFGGDAVAKGVDADAFEIALGARALLHQSENFRVLPVMGLRYLSGSVDGFTESGAGVGLRVDSADIESVMFETGVDFEYDIHPQVTLLAHLGYSNDLAASNKEVSARFAAAGTAATPFAVNALGVEDESLVLGLGVGYSITPNASLRVNWRGDFRDDSPNGNTFGISASMGF